jgi:tetratricopeptide (TPR) repeat protein
MACLLVAGAAFTVPVRAEAPIAERLADCQSTTLVIARRLSACESVGGDKTADPEIRIEALLSAGILLEGADEEQAAIEHYTRVIEIDPAHAVAHYNRANVLELIGQTERALRDYDKAIELDPTDPDFYNNRGLVLLETSETEKALADFDRAFSLGGGELTLRLNRGAVYEKQGRKDAAIADYEKALTLEAGNAAALEGLERLGVK